MPRTNEKNKKMTNQNIEHDGIVKEINDDKIVISILAQSACSSCHAKGICSVADAEEKLIEIQGHDTGDIKIGEIVKVFYRQELGFRALFLGYVLPFLILFSVLIISIIFSGREGFSGLLALGSLIPYYIILYLSKNKINKTFTFSIKKINQKYE